jgi:hypothetical protein
MEIVYSWWALRRMKITGREGTPSAGMGASCRVDEKGKC